MPADKYSLKVVSMPRLNKNSYTAAFDRHVMDICQNMGRLVSDESAAAGPASREHQHVQMIARYNDFINSLRKTAPTDDIATKFQDLISYIGIHFTSENVLMDMLKYPGYDNHREQHSNFICRVNTFVVEIKEGHSTVNDMVLYIGHWLLGHALVADMEFGDFEASLADSSIH